MKKTITDEQIIINPRYVLWSNRVDRLLLALSLFGILCGIVLFILAFVLNNYWLLLGFLIVIFSGWFAEVVMNSAKNENLRRKAIIYLNRQGRGNETHAT